MSRDWKPGDVAIVTVGDTSWRAIRVHGGGWSLEADWASFLNDDQVSARPLVVIDPEDREQVERLARALYPFGMRIGGSCGPERLIEPTAAALREFANPKPPKPDEPMGFAVVVVDRDGERWVSYRQEGDEWIQPWRKDEDHWADYADIEVVTVLSEGVQP